MSVRPLTATVAAAVVSGVLVLAGCTSSEGSRSIPRVSSSSGAAETFVPDQPAVTDDQELVDEPAAAEQSRTDAALAATEVMTAFARPDLPEVEWWNGMLPLLSQEGASAYEGTLPENIPVSAVQGTAVVLDGATDVIALVEVATDAGAYIVTLTRSDASQPWLAERIRPKQG